MISLQEPYSRDNDADSDANAAVDEQAPRGFHNEGKEVATVSLAVPQAIPRTVPQEGLAVSKGIPSDYEVRKLLALRTGKGVPLKERSKRQPTRLLKARAVTIEDILSESQRMSQQLDAVLFESELQRYKPGVSIRQISRWCQVTKQDFLYFKNEWGANCWLGKPILAIPIKYIKAVERANEKTLMRNPKKKEANQFEIFLQDDVDLDILARLKDSSAYDIRQRALEQQFNSQSRQFLMLKGKVLGKVLGKSKATISTKSLIHTPPICCPKPCPSQISQSSPAASAPPPCPLSLPVYQSRQKQRDRYFRSDRG
jgi:hypothetical protein